MKKEFFTSSIGIIVIGAVSGRDGSAVGQSGLLFLGLVEFGLQQSPTDKVGLAQLLAGELQLALFHDGAEEAVMIAGRSQNLTHLYSGQ